MSDGVDIDLFDHEYRLSPLKRCKYFDDCGFINNYKGSAERLKDGWIAMFCADIENSQNCIRKKIQLETDCPPVDNMSPTGKFLG
jgi:hypothetical protein